MVCHKPINRILLFFPVPKLQLAIGKKRSHTINLTGSMGKGILPA